MPATTIHSQLLSSSSEVCVLVSSSASSTSATNPSFSLSPGTCSRPIVPRSNKWGGGVLFFATHWPFSPGETPILVLFSNGGPLAVFRQLPMQCQPLFPLSQLLDAVASFGHPLAQFSIQ